MSLEGIFDGKRHSTMKRVFVLSLFFCLAFASYPRTKRSLLQFREMIHCLTDKSALVHYNGYGCYCGKGGKGSPVDATDRCCQEHDQCYGNLKKRGVCSWWKLYTEKYSFSSENCDTRDSSITCGNGDRCEVGLCQCDKTAAMCFKRSTYNLKYMYWPNWRC